MKRNFALAMMAFFFILPNASAKKNYSEVQSLRRHLIGRYVEEAAAKNRLEVALIRAIIQVESNFNYQAVSRVGARGLMQIMPNTAKLLGSEKALDFSNPRANILAGARLMRDLINRYGGKIKLALAAYNAGTAAVAKYRGIPPYPETRNYVRKVLSQLAIERQRQIY